MKVKTEKCKEKLDFDVKSVLKKYSNNPEKLLEYVQQSGTLVSKIKHAKFILALIGYEEGFIAPLKGLKAVYLTLVLTLMGKISGLSIKT